MVLMIKWTPATQRNTKMDDTTGSKILQGKLKKSINQRRGKRKTPSVFRERTTKGEREEEEGKRERESEREQAKQATRKFFSPLDLLQSNWWMDGGEREGGNLDGNWEGNDGRNEQRGRCARRL